MWGVFVLGILGLNLITSGAKLANSSNLVLGGPDINPSDSVTANISPADSALSTDPQPIPQENIRSDAMAQTFNTAINIKKNNIGKNEQNDPSNQLVIPTLGLDWGILHPHNAVDIANNCGTPIYASYEGFVTKNFNNNEWNSGYGNYIEIKHPNNLSTLYAHLEKSVATLGRYVKTRELIGYMGNTGNVHGPTGCHVHFEVHGGRNPFALK